MTLRARVLYGLGLAACVAYLFALAGDGLDAYFTRDDAINLVSLHGYFDRPAGDLLLETLTVVTPAYRPFGGAVYRVLFDLFGFDPAPFRWAAFALLALNVVVAFRLLLRLSGSGAAALFGTLLLSYHAAWSELYWNTGTLYDLLCFPCYALALDAYAAGREAGERLSLRRTAVVVALYALALNAKEMAATFPAAIVGYEAAWHGVEGWRERLRKLAPTLCAVVALTLAYSAAKLGVENALTPNEAYRIRPSAENFLLAHGRYLGALLYRPETGWLTGGTILGAAALAALARRSWKILFGLGFWLVALAPVAFIPARSAFVTYLPALGLALAAGLALERLTRGRPLAVAAAFVLIGAALVPLHVAGREREARELRMLSDATRTIVEQVRVWYPAPDDGTTFFFENDPYPEDDWTLAFLFQLAYGNPTLVVEREKAGARATAGAALLSYSQGTVERISPPETPPEGPLTTVGFQPDRARPGEAVLVLIPELANETIDAAYRHVVNGRVSAGLARKWCELDATGRGRVELPGDFPESRVEIVQVRPAGGDWLPAEGTLEVRR